MFWPGSSKNEMLTAHEKGMSHEMDESMSTPMLSSGMANLALSNMVRKREGTSSESFGGLHRISKAFEKASVLSYNS